MHRQRSRELPLLAAMRYGGTVEGTAPAGRMACSRSGPHRRPCRQPGTIVVVLVPVSAVWWRCGIALPRWPGYARAR